jgi:ATPase subunit of ABC transporter with duplicated ATPase domains
VEQVGLKKELFKKEYEKYISEVSKLNKFVKRTQDLNSKTSNESFNKVKHESRTAFGYDKWHSEVSFGKQINSAQSKLVRLGDMERPEKESILDVRLNSNIMSSKVILRIKNLSKSFRERLVLSGINLEVRGPERVLISGKNGSGKSTLLNLIVGRSEADFGEIVKGEALSFGYFSQDIYGLDQLRTPIEELNFLERDRARCYMLCVKAGLTKQSADKKISELSRGQQAKLGFVKLMLTQPDVLVLDEPTNHLDVQTKEAIEKALDGFGGAIILASHDKYFVEKIGISQELAL